MCIIIQNYETKENFFEACICPLCRPRPNSLPLSTERGSERGREERKTKSNLGSRLPSFLPRFLRPRHHSIAHSTRGVLRVLHFKTMAAFADFKLGNNARATEIKVNEVETY